MNKHPRDGELGLHRGAGGLRGREREKEGESERKREGEIERLFGFIAG